ncbi:MAG TPA: chemotaxis response regulator protein-glutamate methylesterase [Phycisphaerae bacterium]|nr:chemotaxis response regulator protein-glutamate methylesterase [Phycisphaerae bacterium]
MRTLRVLIVDDAVVVRRILTEILSADAQLEVFSAANGKLALQKLDQVNPDIVTLDIEMPELDGLATLREIRKVRPKLPVIMFSTLTERGASATLDALSAGANDYLTKPANVGSVTAAFARIRDELIPRIKVLCKPPAPPEIPKPLVLPGTPPPAAGLIDVVAIGVSTGGPNALSAILPALPRSLPVPVVIVQHMPPIFTKLLAERLAAQCQIGVEEGAVGARLAPGKAIIAPGGSHMVVRRCAAGAVVELNTDPPENSCRPAVDVLFRSVAAAYGPRVLGVVLTGMGSDGLRGCQNIREVRGQVVIQDEPTSVVWGMPGFVARAGLAERQLPLGRIAAEIVTRSAVGRPALSARAG